MEEATIPAWPPPAQAMEGAGFWIRALARIVDMVYVTVIALCTGVFCGIGFALMEHSGRLSPEWRAHLQGVTVTGILMDLLALILYHTLTEGVHGASFGKWLCGLRVVQKDGSPSNLRGALIRSAAYLLDSLFFGLVGYASMRETLPLRQRFGDRWGRTVVVKTRHLPDDHVRSGWRFVGGLALGSAAYSACCVVSLCLKIRPYF
ncbi:MAG: RDD family protein [Opitutales bacterium]|jgi:uncharacterized RDD family membrane protein YckC